jgi:deoxyribonuclease-4
MFGSHLSIAGGLHNALLAAEKLKIDTVQVFTQSPQSWGFPSVTEQAATKNQPQWAAKPLDESAIHTFRTHADRLGYQKIVAHDSYLINLASADPLLWEKSIAAFREEMRRCDQLGIAYLVTHPGAHCGTGEACGIARVIDAMNRILDEDKNGGEGKVTVCLETTAGQGSCLGCSFDHLATMRRGIRHNHRIGICVDTCHILAAGYDITTESSARNVLAQMDHSFGLEHLKVWHLNDSKKPLNSRVDRHEHIARGHVGLAAFKVICQDARFKDVPKILETAKEDAPDGRPWDEVNLELLRALAAGKNAKPIPFPSRPLEPAPAKGTRSVSAGSGTLPKNLPTKLAKTPPNTLAASRPVHPKPHTPKPKKAPER